MTEILPQALFSDYIAYFTEERLSKGTGIVYSSWSLFHTLFIFLAAVAGPVHSDLLKAMQLSEKEASPPEVSQVVSLLCKDSALALAANIYAKSVTPTAEFVGLVKRYFDIAIEPLKSASQVNNWCSAQTKGLIKSIIDDIKDTDAILISAIYFKANWTLKFSKDDTKRLPFTSLDGRAQERDLMYMKAKLQYASSDSAQMVKLKYNDSNISAVIVLPREAGKASLKATLRYDNFFPADGFLTKEVILKLPKFKLESSHDLKDHLVLRGAGSMFGVCNCNETLGAPMTVTQVIQKAVIEVDEEGTEAAAVTAIRMLCCAMAAPPPEIYHVICDRPFWFMLEHNGIPLFLTAIL